MRATFKKIGGLFRPQPIMDKGMPSFTYKGRTYRPDYINGDPFNGYMPRWMAPAGGAVDVIQGNSYWHNDFLGPADATATVFHGTNGGSHYAVASGATFAVTGVNGGVGLGTMGGDDADAIAVYGPLAYEPDEAGRIWMQVRFSLSEVTDPSIFIGFTDAITDTVIIEDEDGTINTVATDAFGVLLECEQDGTWQTMGVGNNTDDTQYAANNIDDLAASTYTTIFIEADNQGNTANTVVRYRVRVDGKILTTTNTDSNGWTPSVARSSIVYAPAFSADDRGAAYTFRVAEMASNGGLGAALD